MKTTPKTRVEKIAMKQQLENIKYEAAKKIAETLAAAKAEYNAVAKELDTDTWEDADIENEILEMLNEDE